MNKNRNANLKEKYLDGEKLFRKYYEMGETRSINLLTEWIIYDFVRNDVNHVPTNMGVWKSMWRWASLKQNKDIAWEIFSKHNDTVSFDEWVQLMKDKIKTAWQYNTKSKYERFLHENGWS